VSLVASSRPHVLFAKIMSSETSLSIGVPRSRRVIST
jgi:hypothetical protein